MRIDGTLEKYLKLEILPQIARPPFGSIDSIKISHDIRAVYLYQDEISRTEVVGKYYNNGSINPDVAWHKVEHEYSNLVFLRDQLGMRDNNYNVVAPLGRNKVLSALLVLKKAPGRPLDHYISRAIYEKDTQALFYKLSDLSRLFFRLHRNSDSGRNVSLNLPQWYLSTMLGALKAKSPGLYNQEAEIKGLAVNWWSRVEMVRDHEVVVHGDATPTNFFFHHNEVTAIDLEKMKFADRCWDLGFIAAELKHHFMWRTGDGQRAEPFIGHFLWEYGMASGNTAIFYDIIRRLPLYMALGLLRIARNDWIDEKYRNKLIGEARLCLKFKP